MGKFPEDTPETVVVTRCPEVPSYGSDKLKRMGAELRSLRNADPGAVTPGVVQDYQVLRRQCAAYGERTTR